MDEDTDGKDDTKRKSRNLSEKKRRDQFNLLINELSSMVSTNSRKMDKSTVLKSTIAFLKSHTESAMKSRAHEIQEDWKPSFLSNEEFTHLILEALDGFILVFSASGKIHYSSDSVISLLGYKPNDLLNTSLYDMVFEDDQTDLYNLMLNTNTGTDIAHYDGNRKSNVTDNQISFSCHVRRGGYDSTYELVHFVGYFRDDIDTLDSDNINSNCVSGSTNESDCLVFVGTGHLDQPQLLREITVVDSIKSEFTSKHSLEWKFLFLDHRAPPIIGYLPFEVLGTSGYDYYHIDDLDKVVTCHEALMQKGEGTSCYYRFLTKGQQWIWLQTRFYITYHQWNSKPEFIVCTNQVVNYINILKQMDSHDEYDKNQEDNELCLQDSNNKSLQRVSSPWSSKSSVGKASRLALTGVSSPTPSMSVFSSGTRGKGQRMSGGRPDSDSNSLSADSFTSKQSFPRSNPQNHSSHQYRSTTQQKNVDEQQCKMPCLQPGEDLKASCSQRAAQLSVDATNGVATANTVVNQPLGHQQIIDSNASQHFMTAIPVQPVIAAGGYSPAAATLSQAELVHQPLVMSPAQTQLHDQLQRKHEELQQLIFQQQQELRLVSDQLLMARYGLLPASLLSVSVPYSVASPSGNMVTGNSVLKPPQAPSSLPLPTSSDFFVSPHQALVHSPIAVAPSVVVDPQQVQVPSTDLVACNLRPVGVIPSTMYPSTHTASPGVLPTLVVANKSPVPETIWVLPHTIPQYYLLYGAPPKPAIQSDMLLLKTDDSLDMASERQSTFGGSDATQSTLLSQTTEGSDQSFRRVKKRTSRISDQSDDTDTRWPFVAENKRGKQSESAPKTMNRKTANSSHLKAAFSLFRSERDAEMYRPERLLQPMDECHSKILSVQTESRDGDNITPPSKFLETCSSDLFSIPIGELLEPKEEIPGPPSY